MSKESTIAELQEAIIHIKSLIENIKQAPDLNDEDFALSIEFSHIQEHLNRSWHYRIMTEDEILNISQEKFNFLSNCVPNFSFEMRLLTGFNPNE